MGSIERENGQLDTLLCQCVREAFKGEGGVFGRFYTLLLSWTKQTAKKYANIFSAILLHS